MTAKNQETIDRIKRYLSQDLDSEQIAERIGMNRAYVTKLITKIKREKTTKVEIL